MAFLSKPDADDLRLYTRHLRSRDGDDQTPFLPLGPPPGPQGSPPALATGGVHRLLASVGIERPGVAAHALRHAVGGVTQAATGSTCIVQARLHHSSVRTSETYARLPIEDYRAAIDEVASILRRR